MFFPSYLFLFGFLPVAATVYWLLSPRGRRWWLVVSSALFYGWTDWSRLALLAGMTGLTFVAVHGVMARGTPRARRLGLALAFGPLLILVVFKCYDLFATTVNTFGGGIGILHLALPLGISFYTFNLVGYGLDAYHQGEPPARSFLDLAAYATFFPTIASGPLIRYSNFSSAVAAAQRPEAARFELGLFNLGLGLAKKIVIADWIGEVIDPLWRDYAGLGVSTAWLAIVGSHLRLYFDFSGYCDMAVGAGHLLGIQVPANFNAPYTARSITEFWRRWHITLSTWFRDYLYFPINLMLLRRTEGRYPGWIQTLSLLLTMSLIGVWHGLTLTYFAWGAYQGAFLAAHARIRARKGRPWPEWAGRALTTFVVLMGWVLFRSSSLDMAASVYASAFGLRGWGPSPTSMVGVNPSFLLFLGILLVLTNLPRDVPDLRPRRELSYAIGLAGLLVVGLLLIGQPTPFIYFQF